MAFRGPLLGERPVGLQPTPLWPVLPGPERSQYVCPSPNLELLVLFSPPSLRKHVLDPVISKAVCHMNPEWAWPQGGSSMEN